MLVKDGVRLVCFFQDVGLDQFEDVASDSLHRFDHWVVLGLLADDSIAHMLAVEVVDLEQVLEDVLQIVQIDEASAFSHALVDLYNVIDRLDVLVAEELVDVLISVG